MTSDVVSLLFDLIWIRVADLIDYGITSHKMWNRSIGINSFTYILGTTNHRWNDQSKPFDVMWQCGMYCVHMSADDVCSYTNSYINPANVDRSLVLSMSEAQLWTLTTVQGLRPSRSLPRSLLFLMSGLKASLLGCTTANRFTYDILWICNAR